MLCLTVHICSVDKAKVSAAYLSDDYVAADDQVRLPLQYFTNLSQIDVRLLLPVFQSLLYYAYILKQAWKFFRDSKIFTIAADQMRNSMSAMGVAPLSTLECQTGGNIV